MGMSGGVAEVIEGIEMEDLPDYVSRGEEFLEFGTATVASRPLSGGVFEIEIGARGGSAGVGGNNLRRRGAESDLGSLVSGGTGGTGGIGREGEGEVGGDLMQMDTVYTERTGQSLGLESSVRPLI